MLILTYIVFEKHISKNLSLFMTKINTLVQIYLLFQTMLNRRAFSDVLSDTSKTSRRKEEARQVEFVRIGQVSANFNIVLLNCFRSVLKLTTFITNMKSFTYVHINNFPIFLLRFRRLRHF